MATPATAVEWGDLADDPTLLVGSLTLAEPPAPPAAPPAPAAGMVANHSLMKSLVVISAPGLLRGASLRHLSLEVDVCRVPGRVCPLRVPVPA